MGEKMFYPLVYNAVYLMPFNGRVAKTLKHKIIILFSCFRDLVVVHTPW